MARQGKFGVDVPRFEGSTEKRWRTLEDYLYSLEESLRFALERLERQQAEDDEKKE